ncbi:MAG: AMP-binding protein, partial [Halobacteriales archaeon]
GSVPDGVPAIGHDVVGDPPRRGADIPADRPVTLLFTSGTTGEPTPIVHAVGNHAAAAIVAAERPGLGPDDRWYDPLGLHHAGGLMPVVRSAYAQVPVVLAPAVRLDGHLAAIQRHGATVASVVPPMLERALADGEAVPEALRCLLVGGAPLSDDLYARARTAGVPVWPTYGLTETLGQVATATPAERDGRPGTSGRALAGVELRVVADGDSPTADASGRIAIAAPTAAPDATDADGWLRTRDRGRLDDDGYLYVEGRLDDAIRTGGELVWPAPVAEVLEAHPDVREAAVVGLFDARWGEVVAAGVVGADDLDLEELEVHCRDRLDAHARPRHLVQLRALPRTASGTVDRDALRERLAR